MTTIAAPVHSSEALVERMFNAAVAAFDIYGMYLGERLGLYSCLAKHGMQTPLEFAENAGIDERYGREWLEQQAASGILEYADGRFSLPAAYFAVLADRDDPNYFAPLARMMVAAAGQLPKLTSAFGTGDGIAWDEYGKDMIEGQSELNRPIFLHQLGREILPSIPAVHERLSKPGVRVAEIGFGGGWAAIAMAQAYPNVTVTGFDPDESSVELATRNTAEAGLASRVTFRGVDGGEAAAGGERFDVVAAFECVHDLSDPVAVLGSMRKLAGDTGAVLVMDERVPDIFSGEADAVERFMYGWSVTTCLANGRTNHPSAATGTVMRAPTLEGYAKEAGFTACEALPVENDFFRFYLLR
jgi:hypothetical protein